MFFYVPFYVVVHEFAALGLDDGGEDEVFKDVAGAVGFGDSSVD